ncbi:unnamed protein product [Rhizophagus irregularis]|nr:unnamed protein product [Rhizophagus irregularis]
MRLLSSLTSFKVPYYYHKGIAFKTVFPQNYNNKKLFALPYHFLPTVKTFYTRNSHDAVMVIDVHDAIKSEDLHKKVSEKLHVKYLSNSAQELDEVKGNFIGDNTRPFGVMTMKINGQVKNIHFLIATGSPKTYICREVLDSFKLTIPNSNETFTTTLNKRKILANVTPGGFYFSDLNILGTDYLCQYKAQLFKDFEQGHFAIKFDNNYSGINTTQDKLY